MPCRANFDPVGRFDLYLTIARTTPLTPSRTLVFTLMFAELIVVLGVVLIVEGIPWFLSPRRSKRILSELFRMNDSSLRVLGLTFMLIGLLIVYLAKHF